MPKYRIYKITNTTNGKLYVGLTTKTLEARLEGRIRESLWIKRKPPIAEAICKYGAEAFTIELLEEVSSREEAQEKERYYIDELNTLYKNGSGYNAIRGGSGGMPKAERLARYRENPTAFMQRYGKP